MGIYPHAHYLGKDILATAELPDGTQKPLIHIKRWDLNWQAVYRYAEPVSLPTGTTITMRYSYDNSEENTANPNHPPARVRAGNRSSEEMAHLWLQVLPKGVTYGGGDPRMALQEAWARHEVEKAPTIFEAHYNLGEMLQRRGALDEAIVQFQAAASIRPNDPVANNALGGALLAKGDVEGAVQRFLSSIAAQPDYFDAHYNLGTALASQENYQGAVEQFGEAVRLNPDDASAQANLGTALAQLGRLTEAKSHYEAALRIDPSNLLARDNLLQIEQMLRESRH
jgi:Flp pilus assembly protein TadD